MYREMLRLELRVQEVIDRIHLAGSEEELVAMMPQLDVAALALQTVIAALQELLDGEENGEGEEAEQA